MRVFLLALLGSLALALATTTDARGQDERDRVVIRGPGGEVILDDGDILRRRPDRGRGEGSRRGDRDVDPLFRGHGGEGIPKFCRTGEGHPVFGMGWCFDRRMRDESIPAFCRTGEGHPEFGRRWCLERGYGLGSIEGVIFGNDRVFLDLEDEILDVRPSVWERIVDVMIGRRR